jgi:nitrous oxide reductase accessory protein NosL
MIEPKYHPTSNARLKAARQVAKADGWGNEAVYCTAHDVMVTYSRPEEERQAATEYTQGQEAFADDWTEEGPSFHAWAIHAAYLAGIDFARRQHEP